MRPSFHGHRALKRQFVKLWVWPDSANLHRSENTLRLGTNVLWQFLVLVSLPEVRCLSGVNSSDAFPPLCVFTDSRVKAFCSFVAEVSLAAVTLSVYQTAGAAGQGG